LTEDEKHTLIRTAVSELKGSGVKVFAGTGTNDTRETVEISKWASDNGVDGLLIVTPYYNKPTQAGLLAHYEAAAKEVSCPILLYQVPGRTGVRFTVETVCRLAENPKIAGLKEASSDSAWLSELRGELLKKGRGSFALLSGDDPTYLSYLAVGAIGIVSVASNIMPREMVEMSSAEPARALEIHQKYSSVFRHLFIEPNPVPVKQAMEWMGKCRADVRLPLTRIESKNEAVLRAALKDSGLL
jgi:4-hydroxy-tetrahydrodipicolinate synthase